MTWWPPDLLQFDILTNRHVMQRSDGFCLIKPSVTVRTQKNNFWDAQHDSVLPELNVSNMFTTLHVATMLLPCRVHQACVKQMI